MTQFDFENEELEWMDNLMREPEDRIRHPCPSPCCADVNPGQGVEHGRQNDGANGNGEVIDEVADAGPNPPVAVDPAAAVVVVERAVGENVPANDEEVAGGDDLVDGGEDQVEVIDIADDEEMEEVVVDDDEVVGEEEGVGEGAAGEERGAGVEQDEMWEMGDDEIWQLGAGEAGEDVDAVNNDQGDEDSLFEMIILPRRLYSAADWEATRRYFDSVSNPVELFIDENLAPGAVVDMVAAGFAGQHNDDDGARVDIPYEMAARPRRARLGRSEPTHPLLAQAADDDDDEVMALD